MGVGQKGMGLPPLSAGMTLALEFERGTVAGRLHQWQGAQGWDGNQEATDPRVGLWQSLGCTWDLHYLCSGVGLGGPRAELFGKPGELGGLQAGHSAKGGGPVHLPLVSSMWAGQRRGLEEGLGPWWWVDPATICCL